MNVVYWHELDRHSLSELVTEALVLIPVGATEQHGPHLATGTDWLIAESVLEQAAESAAPRAARNLVIAPTVAYGASDHHLPFGGTLSLSAETMFSLLVDLVRSAAASGVRRLAFVNGHGGNSGTLHAASAAASARYDVIVGHIDYWRMLPPTDGVPGHAGEFETSMLLALRPDLVVAGNDREEPPGVSAVSGVDVHSAAVWQALDGYTDRPQQASRERGRHWLSQLVEALSDRLIQMTNAL